MSQTPYQLLRMEKRVADLIGKTSRTLEEQEELKFLEEALAYRAQKEKEERERKPV